MSKDIRSFFAPVKAKPKVPENSEAAKEAKKDSKRRVYNISDSDEEDFVEKPKSKKPKNDVPKESQNKSLKNQTKKVEEKKIHKPVDVNQYFGESPVRQKAQSLIKKEEIKSGTGTEEPRPTSSQRDGKSSNKRKKQAEKQLTVEEHFDDDFDATLSMLDEEALGITPKKVTRIEEPATPSANGVVSDSNNKTPVSSKASPPQDSKSSGKKLSCSKTVVSASKSSQSANETQVEGTPKDMDVKRKANAEAYQRFLNRGGPRNPGSKTIPEGAADCLKGKNFVITGVLESLEREEAVQLIEKHGGRVTTGVSKKTAYVIIGDEPGASKTKKAEELKVPLISEDDLLDIIAKSAKDKKPAKPISESPNCAKDNKTSRPITELPKSTDNVKPVKPVITESPYFRSTENMNTSKSSSSSKKLNFSKEEVDKPVIIKRKDLNVARDSGYTSCESQESKPSKDPPIAAPVNVGSALWVDKYKPKSTKQIIGQNGDKSNVKKLTKWLTDWHKNHGKSEKKKGGRPAPWAQGDDGSYYKAALLSGPPGVGKTTSVHLVCQELGFHVVEFNASDTRSKRLLGEQVAELLGSKTIQSFCEGAKAGNGRHVLVMDEVDGMAGNEDRGGVQELIQLIKNTKTPIICMCNDRSHPKMRSLVNYCFDLRFQRPRVEQIKGAMMSICCREGIQISGDILVNIINSANQDVRQVLHNLALWSVKDKSLSESQAKVDAANAKKSLKMGPWDVARLVFSQSEHEKATLRQKEDLFFQDYNLGPLFVQDTYIHAKPFKAKGDKVKTLECLARAADSLSWGDIVERKIRSQNAWGLLPTQAYFSSVIPGHEMAGHVMGQITFPVWLGKNSKKGRLDRLLQEVYVHSRLSTSGSKQALKLDYAEPLRDAILRPLINEGAGGVASAITVMSEYHLLREDLDSLVEMSQWPNKKDPFATIDSKVKAAFTRAYNKECVATPYAVTGGVKKAKQDDGELLEQMMDGEEAVAADASEEEADDVSADAMVKKVKSKKEPAKKTKDSAGPSNEKKPSKSKAAKDRKK